MTTERTYETILAANDDGALRITFDRPDSLNAWNVQFGEELLAALRAAADDPSVRSITLTGAGRAFSSGADLRAGFQTTPAGKPDVKTPLDTVYHPLVELVRTIPKPVVAAVNGPAVGIGCSLALACDLIVMRESAYFLLAFVNIGLVPDGGSSLFIPARAGFTRAAEMALLGERVPARQALEWNLVNRVLADDEFDAGVDALARRLAEGPPGSYAGTKRQLNAWLYDRMAAQLQLEAEVQQEAAESDDFIEGVTAFLQKRPARFGAAQEPGDAGTGAS